MKRGSRRKAYDLSTGGSLGRVRRAVSSWLGIALLALNVLGAAAIPGRAAEEGLSPFAQELLGDRIIVCTAGGMVVMDRAGHGVHTGQASGHSDFCVFCLPLMHGGAQVPLAPATLADEVPTGPAGDLLPVRPAVAAPARLAGASSPRAPPFLIT